MIYRVIDPQHVYSIYAVEVRADTHLEAKQLALQAMMGCPLVDVDAKVVEDAWTALVCRETESKHQEEALRVVTDYMEKSATLKGYVPPVLGMLHSFDLEWPRCGGGWHITDANHRIEQDELGEWQLIYDVEYQHDDGGRHTRRKTFVVRNGRLLVKSGKDLPPAAWGVWVDLADACDLLACTQILIDILDWDGA
jgi:hypothetical protein